MFGVVGGIVAAGAISAGTAAYSAREAGKAADKQTKVAGRAAATELEFSMQQYEDWQAIYGPIQQRLSSYYNTLDASSLAEPALEQLQKSVQATHERIQSQANLGKIDTAAAEALTMQADMQAARDKAFVRMQAPMQLAQAQQSFVQGGATNPNAGGVLSAYSNQQAFAQQQAQQQSAIASQAGQAAGTAINSTMSAYFSNQAYNQRQQQLDAIYQSYNPPVER